SADAAGRQRLRLVALGAAGEALEAMVDPAALKPQRPSEPLSGARAATTIVGHSPAPALDASARPCVALVNMPFASSRYPSIQLGLLQATLAQPNFGATTHYSTLRFGPRLGWEVFEIFCRQTPRLLGDWLFARAAFRDSAPDPRLYLDAYRVELEPFAA